MDATLHYGKDESWELLQALNAGKYLGVLQELDEDLRRCAKYGIGQDDPARSDSTQPGPGSELSSADLVQREAGLWRARLRELCAEQGFELDRQSV